MKVSTWNVRFAEPESRSGQIISEVLAGLDSDVIVLTEGRADLLPDGGHVVDGGIGWGYEPSSPNDRKVILWSKMPWNNVDLSMPDEMPPCRLASASTETPLGPIRVVGVAVPWSDEHVRGGRGDSLRWQEHRKFLTSLKTLTQPTGERTIVAGDLNQKIPRFKQPIDVFEMLSAVLDGYEIPTAAIDEPQLMDHIAHSADLSASGMPIVIDHIIDSVRLSDHTGVSVEFANY